MQSILINLAVGIVASLIASFIAYGIKKIIARKNDHPSDHE